MHALQESKRNKSLEHCQKLSFRGFSIQSRCFKFDWFKLLYPNLIIIGSCCTYNAQGHQNRSMSNIDDEFLEWQDCCDETVNFDLYEVTCYKDAVFDNELTNRLSSVNGRFNILEFWSSLTLVEKFSPVAQACLWYSQYSIIQCQW